MLTRESTTLLASRTIWGGEFENIQAARSIYHPQTGQTVVLASIQPVGGSYGLWCFLVKGGVVTGPLDLGISWDQYYYHLYCDKNTGTILMVAPGVTLARVDVSLGSATAAGPWTGFNGFHPVDGAAFLPYEDALCFTAADDFYFVGSWSNAEPYTPTHLAARRYTWTGSSYAMSTDLDIILDDNRPALYNVSAHRGQDNDKIAVFANRFSEAVTVCCTGTATVGTLNIQSTTIFNGGATQVQDPYIDFSSSPSLVLFHNLKVWPEITYLSHGLLAETLVLTGEYTQWNNVSLRRELAVDNSRGFCAALHQQGVVSSVLVVDKFGEIIGDLTRLTQSSSSQRSSLTINPVDDKIYAIAYETSSTSTYADRGLNLITLSAPVLQFWTNFVGQSERPA